MKVLASDRNLAGSALWLEEALSAAGDAAYMWDVPTDQLHWAGSIDGFHDRTRAETLSSGHSLNDRIHPEDLPRRLKALSDHFALGRVYDCEYRLRSGQGQTIWVHDRGIARFDQSGTPLRMTGTVRNVTQRKLEEARLERVANYDDLTGHYNRSRLRQELDHAISVARRFTTHGALLVVGVDKLAMINNAYGHETGDAVLVSIGQRLDRFVRSSDIIGRLAGDRFGVVLTQCPENELSAALERVVAMVRERPIDLDGQSIPVTVSVGCVPFPSLAGTAYDLITRAESALAGAKAAGRSCWNLYKASELQTLAHRRNVVMGASVQRAIRENRLLFTYQPIVRSGDFAVEKYECLLRMKDEKGQIVSAHEIVPVVEQLGLTRMMDRHVLEMAIAELRKQADLSLAINISGLTATDQSWLRALMSCVKATPDVAARLVIEITETAALHDIEETARFVSAARDLGCRVAIDDFGAGFTSFRHLKSLTVDMVKIDGSFVRGLAANVDNQLFIRNLMSLAEAFGLKTVAEFVENRDDAEFLMRCGVDFLQGYYFGRPDFERRWTIRERIEPQSALAS
jgi:diguanylate cyclase (GGDEF)-like protein